MNPPMTPSDNCTQLVATFEGLMLDAYQDGAGVWTIGYGHTAGVKKGDVTTLRQAIDWLSGDLVTAGAAVNRFASGPLTQNQFDALTSFTFNLGAGTLEHSTLLRLLNAGQTIQAALEFPKWDHVNGKPSAGLLKRRLAERDLFLRVSYGK